MKKNFPNILHQEKKLKRFFKSRIPLTSIKAGIIVGSGSASFEIIRDLVEKLPLMITPKWLKHKTPADCHQKYFRILNRSFT